MTHFIGMPPSLRQRIETTVESLLALLDEVDGDENREPELAGFDRYRMDDREEDHDFEPSIGSPNDLEHDDCDYG